VRPSLSAGEGAVFWSAEVDTSIVLLATMPVFLPAAGNLASALNQAGDALADEHGLHSRYASGNEAIRLLRLSAAPADTPLAALVPLDGDGLDRIEAIDRLLRALLGRPVPADRRLTAQQRRRHRLMLQATDGRANGASYRDIAEVLYGPERIRAEHWKTSALRDSVIGLVEGGAAMVAGGYRQLLRHRRPT